MAAAVVDMLEPSYGMDKLSYEIFSILESKFLFGCADDVRASAPVTPARTTAGGRVRVLSVDAGGSTGGLLAAASLARMEARLRHLSGDPAVRISEFFDLAAGSGVGGVLVALLFTQGPDGRPPLSAAEAVHFLARHQRELSRRRRGGRLRALLGGGGEGITKVLRRALGESTLRDTVKPVLIPCYDLATGAPFVFSRADAVETDGYDFRMWEACAATMGVVRGGGMRSVDGRTGIAAAAVDGGVATGNPAVAAVTHVLNNRSEFPGVRGVEDLLLVSLGNGEASGAVAWRPGSATPSHAGIARIAGDGVSDMIDQAVAMAFGQSMTTGYVRIQGRDVVPAKANAPTDPAHLLLSAEAMLSQKNLESVLFVGKKLSERTNLEKLEWAAGELIRERERRNKCPFPMVVFKQGSPRSSSSSSALSSSLSSSP